MPYQSVREFTAETANGPSRWYINGVTIPYDDLYLFRKMQVEWPNGSILYHRVRVVSLNTNARGANNIPMPVHSIDLMMRIRFHGMACEISLLHNPKVRELVQGIQWRYSSDDLSEV